MEWSGPSSTNAIPQTLHITKSTWCLLSAALISLSAPPCCYASRYNMASFRLQSCRSSAELSSRKCCTKLSQMCSLFCCVICHWCPAAFLAPDKGRQGQRGSILWQSHVCMDIAVSGMAAAALRSSWAVPAVPCWHHQSKQAVSCASHAFNSTMQSLSDTL